MLRSVVLNGWCTGIFYLLFSASDILNLSNKDSLRKVKVQKDLVPIGNKPSPSLYTGLLTPRSWEGFMAEKEAYRCWLAGWSTVNCTYSCHHAPLCFPCDSLISGAPATGLGCAHDGLEFLSRLSSKHLLPLNGSEEILFLTICQLTQSWPKQEGIFHQGFVGFGKLLSVCSVGKSSPVGQKLGL